MHLLFYAMVKLCLRRSLLGQVLRRGEGEAADHWWAIPVLLQLDHSEPTPESEVRFNVESGAGEDESLIFVSNGMSPVFMHADTCHVLPSCPTCTLALSG